MRFDHARGEWSGAMRCSGLRLGSRRHTTGRRIVTVELTILCGLRRGLRALLQPPSNVMVRTHCTATAGARVASARLRTDVPASTRGRRVAASTPHRARCRSRCALPVAPRHPAVIASLPAAPAVASRRLLNSLQLRRPTEWSPLIMGLDYGQHRATGTTALVCLRGSGSRLQTAGDGARGPGSLSGARAHRPPVQCRSRAATSWRVAPQIDQWVAL
jgi:hypothetical protein